jgi:hypothetical protein
MGIKDFLSGFRETAAADRNTTPRPFRRVVFVILVVILSVLIWILLTAIQ